MKYSLVPNDSRMEGRGGGGAGLNKMAGVIGNLNINKQGVLQIKGGRER